MYSTPEIVILQIINENVWKIIVLQIKCERLDLNNTLVIPKYFVYSETETGKAKLRNKSSNEMVITDKHVMISSDDKHDK